MTSPGRCRSAIVDELKAKGFANTGALNIGGAIVTASGLLFIGATNDGYFRAFDSRSGKQLWETTLEASAHSIPMTFMGKDGRQYVVVAAGGGSFLGSAPGHEDRRVRPAGADQPMTTQRSPRSSRCWRLPCARA